MPKHQKGKGQTQSMKEKRKKKAEERRAEERRAEETRIAITNTIRSRDKKLFEAQRLAKKLGIPPPKTWEDIKEFEEERERMLTRALNSREDIIRIASRSQSSNSNQPSPVNLKRNKVVPSPSSTSSQRVNTDKLKAQAAEGYQGEGKRLNNFLKFMGIAGAVGATSYAGKKLVTDGLTNAGKVLTGQQIGSGKKLLTD